MTKSEEKLVEAMKTVVDAGYTVGTEAALEGGKRAGRYLDQIGKTDLGALSDDEWSNFCNTMVSGALIHGLSRILPPDAVPF